MEPIEPIKGADEAEDERIYNALKANPDVVSSLTDDEAAELEAAVDRHLRRLKLREQAASPGAGGVPVESETVKPSETSSGAEKTLDVIRNKPMPLSVRKEKIASLPPEMLDKPHPRFPDFTYRQILENPALAGVSRSFLQGAVPFATDIVALPEDDETKRRLAEAYAVSAEQYPWAKTVGSVAQAIGLAKLLGALGVLESAAPGVRAVGGLPVVARPVAPAAARLQALKESAVLNALGSASAYLTDASNREAQHRLAGIGEPESPIETAVGALGSAATGAALGPAIDTAATIGRDVVSGRALSRLLGTLEEKTAAGAAKRVRDWTDQYAREASVDPERIMGLQRSPSTKGFGSSYDDVLYEIAENVLPGRATEGIGASPYDIRQRALANLAKGEEAVSVARAPMRLDVRREELSAALRDAARELRASGLAGGEEAARIIERQGDDLLGGVGEGTVNTKELEKIITGISSPNFKLGLGAANPDEAVRLASDKLVEVQARLASEHGAGTVEDLLRAHSIANQIYAPKRKAADAVFAREATRAAPPSPGYATDSALGMATRATLATGRGRISTGIASGAKQALNWAHKRLAARVPESGLIPPNEAPFQLEAFKRQVEWLSKMSEQDAAPFLYVAMTTDPVFAALWKKSQEEPVDEYDYEGGGGQ